MSTNFGRLFNVLTNGAIGDRLLGLRVILGFLAEDKLLLLALALLSAMLSPFLLLALSNKDVESIFFIT